MELDHQNVLKMQNSGELGLWYWYFSALGGWINVSKPLVLQASKDALGGWIHSFVFFS